MTYELDQTTDCRWYVHWNGEFIGFYKTFADAVVQMAVHESNAVRAGL